MSSTSVVSSQIGNSGEKLPKERLCVCDRVLELVGAERERWWRWWWALERGTGTAREAGVGVAGGCVAGFLRRASFPEGRAAKDGTLVDPSFDGSNMVGGRRFSESESELTRKGSNELEAGFLLWAKDCEEIRAVPSACEEDVSGGEGWRTL